MLDVRALERQTRRRRAGMAVMALAVVAGGGAAWNAEQRRESSREEVRWLRLRLGERREQVWRLREEMAQVASRVGDVTQAASGLGEQAAAARQLAQLKGGEDPAGGYTPVSLTGDGGDLLVSDDTARALEQLRLLEERVATGGDSLAVLTALLRERPPGEDRDSPSLWPVRGLITSPFGMRPSPYDGTREMHSGIDIQAHYGMPVTASGDGEVIFAGRDSGYGRLVVVSHGGNLDTFYGHLSAIYVREGQRVRRGQPIGAVGASGRATGAHLHYEVRVRNSPVDPHRYLN
jgi:murein DD-endopeptidase MepM/ murein hydrolase activator NlpD